MNAEKRLLITATLFLPLAATVAFVWPRFVTPPAAIFRAQLAVACFIDALVLLEASYSVLFHGRRPLFKAIAAIAALAVILLAVFAIANRAAFAS